MWLRRGTSNCAQTACRLNTLVMDALVTFVISFDAALWWALIMSGPMPRSRRRIAGARLRKGLANVAGSQA